VRRKLFWTAVWALSLASLASLAACGDDGDTSSTGGGGTGGAGYGDGACGACVKDACAGEIEACAGDPGCAQYLTCLYACPVDAAGDADAACAAGCTVPDSSTAEAARAAVEDCRGFGRGATQCPACGAPENTHPLLNQECAPSSDPNACFACEDEHCCETYAACEAGAECDALVECIRACPDAGFDACKTQCEADHPAGVAGYGARIGCLLVFCADADACGNVPLDGCSKCINAKCADEFIACWANPECYLLSECSVPCGADEACIEACGAAHPDGAQAFGDYALCGTQACSAECG